MADVGLHAALLARPRRGVADVVAVAAMADAPRAPSPASSLIESGRPLPRLKTAAGRRGYRQRAHPAVDDVVDVDEVARLLAVAEDRDRLAAQQVAEEDAEHALVGIVPGLARARRR